MRKPMTVALALALGCGVAACQKKAVQATGPEPPRVVASIQEIMDSEVDPAADVIWDSLETISDANGVVRHEPRTDEDWQKVRHAAVILTEAPNLLAMPGRQVVQAGKELADADAPGNLPKDEIQKNLDTRHDEFAGFARALQEVGIEALQAIDRKDVAALDTASGKIDDVCEQCHLQFWYPGVPQG